MTISTVGADVTDAKIRADGGEQGSTSKQRTSRPSTPLDEIEPSPPSHFKVSLHAAVLLLVDHLRDLDDSGDLHPVLDRYPFLAGYLDAIVPFLPPAITWQQAHRWWSERITAWEHHRRANLALCRVSAALSLSDVARAQLLLAGLIDEDSRFGQIFRDLSGGVARRPTFETLIAIGSHLDPANAASDARQLIECAVLTVVDRDGPRSEWIMSPSTELWDQVRGDAHPHPDHRPVTDLPKLAELVVDDTVRERCHRIADRWTEFDLVTVRGTAGSDRLALVAALAQAAGKGMLSVEACGLANGRWDRVGALAAALDAVPVVELDLAPGDTAVVPRPAGLPGPVVVVLGATGGVDRRGHDRAVSIELPMLDAASRARRWRLALGAAAVDDVDGIAAACRLQGAHIDRVAQSAISLATVDSAAAVRLAHVRLAADELQRQLLDTLATKLDVAGCWDDVVVGDFTAIKLAELEARCRHREALAASMGACVRRRHRRRRARPVHRAKRNRQDARRPGARKPARPRRVPRRPRGDRQQVHRRDREEPPPHPDDRRRARRDPAHRRRRLAARPSDRGAIRQRPLRESRDQLPAAAARALPRRSS